MISQWKTFTLHSNHVRGGADSRLRLPVSQHKLGTEQFLYTAALFHSGYSVAALEPAKHSDNPLYTESRHENLEGFCAPCYHDPCPVEFPERFGNENLPSKPGNIALQHVRQLLPLPLNIFFTIPVTFLLYNILFNYFALRTFPRKTALTQHCKATKSSHL